MIAQAVGTNSQRADKTKAEKIRAEKIEMFLMTLAQQVALYAEQLDILSTLVRRSNAQRDFVLSRMQWVEDNPNAPQLYLMQGTVRQAQDQLAKTGTEAEAVMQKIGVLYWLMVDDPAFLTDYRPTALRVPNGLSRDGEQIDLWDWELRLNETTGLNETDGSDDAN